MVVPFVYTEEELQKEIRAKESWRDLYREQLEKNKKQEEKIRFLEECLDRKEKVNKQLREDIDNGFNRETDLKNKRADSLLENKDLRDKIEELKEELGKMVMKS